MPANAPATMEKLDETQCLRLVSAGIIGRIAFVGQYDLTVLPVNYRVVDGAILFRTAHDSLAAEDLRTGIEHAEYRVAFEVDDFDEAARAGWSVLIQGPAHYVEPESALAAVLGAGIDSWPGGEKNQVIQITPVHVTGRRVRQVP